MYQKIVSNSKFVSEAVFFRFFVIFLEILGSKMVGSNELEPVRKRFRTPSGFQRLFVIDFGPSNEQKCHLASTKCTLMSVLNVKTQGFCNAFSNFPTFFQSKRTSRCPKLVPNDYFCSCGDTLSMGLGEVSLLARNP